ncbi:hypothetical protein S100390_v1c06100 [Spiroplasma sp. NBRC 100390]|uniref:hypothetical protein n=1 Tax=unclassified Spiroplasma TaxID=2637901 RepID=UPI0008928ED8|nr:MULTISPECIES: hypothetical protein [unclassified Spiroplasma]AOX43947.1 hypothetical protein STU14_v1c06100 [Spiroplasma sp. TU-14]APE13417.1 hypothetical protein S100390_v1c06100 [Spiroplasma sp. NBRC 100390]
MIYPDQVAKFKDLVTDVKTNNGKDLVGEAISEWRFLDQLVTAFKTEFDNLNRAISNEYSNFYLNTLPLSMETNDIRFNLEHINFDNLEKLITVNNLNIMGITINFNISYQIKFKDLEQPDKIDGLVVIANDLEALSGIQKNLENYFISFIDELLKKQKYEIIDSLNRDFNDMFSGNTIWPIIEKELNARKISFKNSPSWNYYFETFRLSKTVSKSDSVLSWAGEGYNAEKLTPENFLKFYKRKYFQVSSQEDYYVKANIESFKPSNLTIENLPFNNKHSFKKLKTSIKVLTAKDFVDQKLNEFAETTMNLWHYFQIETYNDKLVFKMNQNDFDNLVKATNSFSEKNNSYANLVPVFRAVFKIFNDKLDKKITRDTKFLFFNSSDKVKLIKQDSSFAFQLFRKQHENGYYPYLDVNFSYNSFAYSFFFKPNDKETNTDKKDEFLQTIEFKVV